MSKVLLDTFKVIVIEKRNDPIRNLFKIPEVEIEFKETYSRIVKVKTLKVI